MVQLLISCVRHLRKVGEKGFPWISVWLRCDRLTPVLVFCIFHAFGQASLLYTVSLAVGRLCGALVEPTPRFTTRVWESFRTAAKC